MDPMIEEKARRILGAGSIKIRVSRSGMLQQLTFRVKRVKLGPDEFVELYVGRVLEMGELKKVAKETGLPVESENGRAFPEGKGAKDFVV